MMILASCEKTASDLSGWVLGKMFGVQADHLHRHVKQATQVSCEIEQRYRDGGNHVADRDELTPVPPPYHKHAFLIESKSSAVLLVKRKYDIGASGRVDTQVHRHAGPPTAELDLPRDEPYQR